MSGKSLLGRRSQAPRPRAGGTAAALQGPRGGRRGWHRRGPGEARENGPGQPREVGRGPVSCADGGEGWRQERGAGGTEQEPWRPPPIRPVVRMKSHRALSWGSREASKEHGPPSRAGLRQPSPLLSRYRACPTPAPSDMPFPLPRTCFPSPHQPAPHVPVLWEEGWLTGMAPQGWGLPRRGWGLSIDLPPGFFQSPAPLRAGAGSGPSPPILGSVLGGEGALVNPASWATSGRVSGCIPAGPHVCSSINSTNV